MQRYTYHLGTYRQVHTAVRSKPIDNPQLHLYVSVLQVEPEAGQTTYSNSSTHLLTCPGVYRR